MVKFQDSTSTLRGGGLKEEYTLDHFHFHWGSEHTIRGRRYPLEMHLVHYATRFGSIASAKGQHEGIAVLGVLFELSLDDDENFAILINSMKKVVKKVHNSVKVHEGIAPDSFLPRETGGYYRYSGSLTTPTCDEGVIWTVFTSTVPISQQQVSCLLKNNYYVFF